jgi:predicted dehydrogenase
MIQDFRRILDDKEVDVLVIATPDHWHALGTIMACQAGKDVFVEKPLAHNIWEGRKMIEAARKYDRVVQVGMQSRSTPYMAKAKEYIQSGRLGKVPVVRVCNMMEHPRREAGDVAPVPEEFDYDLWCGPARKLPYRPELRWLNYWEYSCGPIAGDAVHQLDLARFITGDKPYPKTVSHAGGIDVLDDGRDTPDTQLAVFQYDSFRLLFEAGLWMPYVQKIPADIRESDKVPNWPFSSTRLEVFGSEGFMYVGRHGGGWQAFDPDGNVVHTEYGRRGDIVHEDNFIECVRNRKRPNADVEIGHQSVLLCHLANISYRLGDQKLEFDGKTETFVGNREANGLIKRSYRKPWEVPDKV